MKKPVILLLHGFTASPFEMAELKAHLAQKGFKVSAPLIAGHGRGSAAFNLAGRDEWLQSAEDAFRKLKGAPVILIGHSMGADLAILLSQKHVSQTKALVLGAPALRLQSALARLARFPLVRLFKPVIHAGNTTSEARHWTQIYNSDRVAELIALGREAEAALENFRGPLLYLQAKGDTLISRPYNEAVLGRLQAKGLERRVYASEEHNVFHHSNPLQGAVFGYLDAFLVRILKSH